MERVRVKVCFEGRVQGVGFRYAVKALAAGFEVVGTVCNLADGRVELVAEGQRPELEGFCEAIRESQVGSFIRGERVLWGPSTGTIRGFEILKEP